MLKFKLLTQIACFFLLTSFSVTKYSDYDIEAFYKGVVPTDGTKVLNSHEDLEDAKLILVPIDIDKGKYIVKVTKKGTNLYKVDDKSIYIQTKYCYEYSYSQEVVLNIEASYSYSKGKIIF